MVALTNWAGSHTYRATQVLHPESLPALQAAVASTARVRALGSRHSFTDVADTSGILIALDELPTSVEVNPGSRTVSVNAGATYGTLATALEQHGWALANLASLPHISLAGSIATGTHGSGDRNRSLAGAVRGLDIVGPDGELRLLRMGDLDFDGSVVGLGALGIVTRLELEIEPTYDVRQDVYTSLSWDDLVDRFDELAGHGYSVSLFTRFDDRAVTQMWVKSRVSGTPPLPVRGAVPAGHTMHMLDGAPTEALTEQHGVAGPWVDRLPHFKMEFTPSRGAELQSEYLVPRHAVGEAVDALRSLSVRFAPLLQSAEIRTVAADDLWLSSSYGRDAVGFHFTWVCDVPAVRGVLGPIEDALLPLQGRPHWGKVFLAGATELRPLYSRFDDFLALRDRVDPDRKFGNAFLDHCFG
jgi:xylitol oxidase